MELVLVMSKRVCNFVVHVFVLRICMCVSWWKEYAIRVGVF
jgi:hypothetical protein